MKLICKTVTILGFMTTLSAIPAYAQSQQNPPALVDNRAAAEVYTNQGLILGGLGDLNGGIENYTQAIKIYPNCANAYYKRSVTNFILGNNIGVNKDYNQVLQISPNYDAGLRRCL